MILVEACVEAAESAVAAAEGGAGRVELCDNLVEGGTTPSAGAIAIVRRRLTIPVHVMIRPRGGDFCYSNLELAVMRRDIAVAKELGAHGVVFGLLAPDGSVDVKRTKDLIKVARPLAVTFHRAFDMSRDPFEALDALIALGVERVLTSGQQPSVPEGLPLIRELVAKAAGRIGVLPGGGITPANAAQVVKETGVTEIHMHAARTFPSPMTFRNARAFMGSRYEPDEYRRTEADAAAFRAVVQVLGGSKTRTPKRN